MKKLFLLALGILLFYTGAFAQPKTEVDLKVLDEYYAQMVENWEVPGASIGIVKDGELLFTGNYGTMETGSNQKPNEHTLYAIASNSKAFTSAMIGMLVQEGKLSWDDKVQKYLPYFELYDPWVSSHTTIRDILSHRVGLGTFSGDNIWYKSELPAEDIIKRIKHVPQAYAFRAGYGYSNLMYITAGEIIETITGKSWAENVQERILDPLDMDRTIASVDELASKGNFATPHARKNEENYAIPWAKWDNVAATGGLISSVSDISRWMIFNLNHGIIGQDTLLTPATRNNVWRPHNNFYVDHTQENDLNTHFSAYGLGWGLRDYHGRMMVRHTGGYDGMITAVTLIPDENLGVVVLTNGPKSPIIAATYYALDKFLGVAEEKDWSAALLESANQGAENDTRIEDRMNARVLDTQPIISPQNFVGDYYSKLYGDIHISRKDDQLRLEFSHSPLLSATLTHWHYDVWKINWEHPQAWFSFGTIKIQSNSKLEVTGLEFDVPNDDFFFEEIKPKKVKTSSE
ncbi:MAG TPA: serine hydrolase [Saprospiraceae bacterium]|nr:serine hydrolase [Saprospiraceae bacterium]